MSKRRRPVYLLAERRPDGAVIPPASVLPAAAKGPAGSGPAEGARASTGTAHRRADGRRAGRRHGTGLAAAVTALALVGAGAVAVTFAVRHTDAADGTASAPRASSPARSEDGRPAAAPERASDPASFSLAFAGDVHFERQLRSVADDPEGLAALRPYFADVDLAVVNLETAITSGGTRLPTKDFAFRAPESALTTLANAGIDAITMANNHAADYGDSGLADTLAAAQDSPVEIFGIGEDADAAFAPLSTHLDGAEVAVLASSALWEDTYEHHEATDTAPGIAAFVEPERMLTEVEAAARTHDVVIAYMHMGEEGSTCVRDVDARRAEQLVDAGADIVVAAHAHRLAGMGHQDMGPSGEAFVAYGLGNVVWYTGGSGPSSHTGVLSLDVEVPFPGAEDPGTRVTDFEFQPMVIGSDGIPRVPDAGTVSQIESEVAAANRCSPIGG
ncbi:CapA family protein [Brevibacterium sp.]|uniref:CapA family protein n=1 Tax=Brevibacterium sp. TaxID=1701 RepID=UPI0025C66E09|nr:CapA family protein [Brevibacterium sp.]